MTVRYRELALATSMLVWTGCSTMAPTPAAPTETLDRIKSTGVIRLGFRTASAPFSFTSPDGKPTGYSVELCERVAASLRTRLARPDLRLEWYPVTPENRISAVRDGLIDLECGSTTNTLARQEEVDFSHMTFVDGASLLIRPGASAPPGDDIKGLRIAVVPGTTTERLIREAVTAAGGAAQLVPVKEHDEGLAALDAGRADAYASDRVILIGLALRGGEGGRYAILDRYLSYEPYGLMLRRGDAAFRLAVNRELSRIYRSGEITEVYRRWFGRLGQPSALLVSMYALHSLPE
jgi:glutamate/aspartate transport system substrate-binding protein